MKEATLKRTSDDGIQTLGLFMFEGEDDRIVTLGSLERPWKDNAKNISCIPRGTYKVTTTHSNHFKENMWLVNNVPDREGVRIHSANYFNELEGCISLGLSREDLNKDGELDMVNSRKALSLAKHYLGESFELHII